MDKDNVKEFYSDKNRVVIDYTANMNTYSSPINGVNINTEEPSNNDKEVK